MNFNQMLNDEHAQAQTQAQAPPAHSDQPYQPAQQHPPNRGLQHLLGMDSHPTSNGTYSATHDFVVHSDAPTFEHQQQQQPMQGSAAQAQRAPHYTTYGQQLPTAVPLQAAGPFGAFDLLSQAAQQALDPDAYVAQLNQPSIHSAQAAVGHALPAPLPPALNVVPASQERRSTRRASQLVSPSSSLKVVPDSDEDAEGEQDIDAEGEDDRDVMMYDREGRDGSLTSSGARRGKSIKAEDEDVEMDGSYDKKPSIPRVPKPKAPPRPKTTRAQRKANKVKAGKARAALYGNNIKPTPPPVSHKAKSKDKGKDYSNGANGNGEDDQDGLKALNTNFPHASTSNLSSSANSPLPSATAQAARPPFVRPAKTQLPTGPLSAPFETYAPPRGSDSEEDDLAKAWNNRRKGKGRVKVATNGQEQGEEEEEVDDRLYCICHKLYEPERMMIACDKCEEWYHTDCMEIRDDNVELVDQFICPKCRDPSTHAVTTWKSRCARPTCRKPVAPLSKYCSDYCGIEVAATRLDLCGLDAEYFWPRVVGARRREAQVFDMKKTEAVPIQTDPQAEVNQSLMDEEASRRQEEEESRTLKRLEEKIRQLVARRESLDGKLFLVEARSQYLKITIKRWEALCQATADTVAAEREEAEREEAERAKEEGEEEEEEEAEQDGEEEEEEQTPAAIKARERAKNKNKNKNKAKKRGTRRVANVGTGPTNIPEAQCGLDVRLVFDSAQWEEWVKSEEGREVLAKVELEGGEGIGLDEEDMERVCLMPRKKCERHTGWQKVREADFDIEKSVISRRLERLASQEASLRAQVADLEEYAQFRAFYRHRVGTVQALSVDKEMKALEQLTPDEKLARRLLLHSIHAPIPQPEKEKTPEEEEEVAQGGQPPRETPLTMEEIMATLVEEAVQTDKEREKEKRLAQRRADRERVRAARDRAIEKEALAREAAEAQKEVEMEMARRGGKKMSSPELGVEAQHMAREEDEIPYELLSRSEQLKRRSRR